MSYLDERRGHILNGRPLKTKEKKPIPKKSAKRIAKEKAEREERGGDDSLDKWFEHFMKISEPVCEECGMRADWLKAPQSDPQKAEAYRLIWRACQAHILPKKKVYGFPSLATNRDNHMVLFPSWGGHLCGCHGVFDSGWYNASTMKVWDKVVNIFKEKLYLLIPEKEKKNIPEQLQSYINEK